MGVEAKITDCRAIELTRGGPDGESERIGFAVETRQAGVESWVAYSTAIHVEHPLVGFYPTAKLAYEALVAMEKP